METKEASATAGNWYMKECIRQEGKELRRNHGNENNGWESVTDFGGRRLGVVD